MSQPQQQPCVSMFLGLLVLMAVAPQSTTTHASNFRRPVAAIFGMGSPKEEHPRSRGPPEQRLLPPPPPNKGTFQSGPPRPPPSAWNGPPPPPRQQHPQDGSTLESINGQQGRPRGNSTSAGQAGPQTQRVVPPPPTIMTYGPPPPPQNGWHEGPWIEGPPMDAWMHPSGAYPPNGQNNLADLTDSLQHDLEEATRREQNLIAQVQNLTKSAMSMQQREDLHVRQLDVLTERVMDVEAAASKEHNQLLEYKANCTKLDKQIAILKGEVEEWRSRCGEFANKTAANDKRIEALKKELREESFRAEDLAALIERHRIREDGPSYSPRRKQKKSKGFFGWLFGWVLDDEEDFSEMQDKARSTLLQALQQERNSVDELEATVAALQQNNSAIAEQVESRDGIIDELNDRIAVFEEDKVVLKAALRQLQKEMKEDAPKIQQLMDDLAAANAEIEGLHEEIEALVETHQEEISALQLSISEKQATITQTESNLTIIGTYVDKLEERLADFAVARRDIQAREAQCREMEKISTEAQAARDQLAEKAEALEAEHAELKKLLEELIQERAQLRSEKTRALERHGIMEKELRKLQQSLSMVSGEARDFKEAQDNWSAKSHHMELELNATVENNRQLRSELEGADNEIRHLQRQLSNYTAVHQELVRKLSEADLKRQELDIKFEQLESVGRENEEMKERLAALEATGQEKERLLARINELNSTQRENELLKSKLSELEALKYDKLELESKIAFMEELQNQNHLLTKKLTALEASLESARATIATTSNQTQQSRAPVKDSKPKPSPTWKNRLWSTKEAASLSKAAPGQQSMRPPTPPKPLMNHTVPVTNSSSPRTANAATNSHAAPTTNTSSPGLVASHKNSSTTSNQQPPRPISILAPPPKNSTGTSRAVPFRKARKFLSKTTGIHGLITPSSTRRPRTKDSTPSQPQRPNTLKHTLGGIRFPTGKSKKSDS